MLLSPNPSDYHHLLGIENRARFLLGKRIEGAGGNPAIHRHFSNIANGKAEFSDNSEERLVSYWNQGGHTQFGPVDISDDVAETLVTRSQNIPDELTELWTTSINSFEAGGLKLTRTRAWGVWLANTSRTLVEKWHQGEKQYCFDKISALEYAEAPSIQLGLRKLQQANSPEAFRDAMIPLYSGTLLFIVACIDADMFPTEDGMTYFGGAVPRVVDGQLQRPMTSWMNAVRKILDVQGKQDVTDILLRFREGDHDTSRREGKRYWSGGKLPSYNTFSQMATCAKTHKPEKLSDLDTIFKLSPLVTFMHNLDLELRAETDAISWLDPMVIFSNYSHFFKIAKSTKGPVPE